MSAQRTTQAGDLTPDCVGTGSVGGARFHAIWRVSESGAGRNRVVRPRDGFSRSATRARLEALGIATAFRWGQQLGRASVLVGDRDVLLGL